MNANSRSIAAAVAVSFISSGFVAHADNYALSAQVRCSGINSCKGQRFCAAAKNVCAGQDAYKGQGWLRVIREECSAKSGRVLPDQGEY